MENEVKEPAPKFNYISPDEYLALERASEEKHEYYDGFIVAMSDARLRHNQITGNVLSEIGNFLKGKKCQVLPSDMRVSTPNRDTYMYPDLSIVCGKPELEDEQFDTLKNPSVVFEIWSSSTQKNDVGYKLIFYQHIPSLQEYIMIDSAKRFAQVVRKQKDGAWRFEDIVEPGGTLFIETISFRIPFGDIYYNTGL